MDEDAQKIIRLSGVPFEGSPAQCFMTKFTEMSHSHPLDPKARILDNCAVLLSPSNFNKQIHISSMDSLIRGGGTAALKKIVALADECGVPLSLLAYGYQDTPTKKLVEWYSRYGFVTTGIGNDKDGWRMSRVPKQGRLDLSAPDDNPVVVKLKGFDRPH